jgi:hypothetical protein
VAAGAWHRLPAAGWKLARGELIRKKADRPKRIIEETNHLKPRAGQSGAFRFGQFEGDFESLRNALQQQRDIAITLH